MCSSDPVKRRFYFFRRTSSLEVDVQQRDTHVIRTNRLFQFALSVITANGQTVFSESRTTLRVWWAETTLVFIAVIKLRKTEPDLVRPYKVPLYPIIPIVAIIGGIFILVMTLINQFQLAMVGIVITALGIPFYIYLKKKYK